MKRVGLALTFMLVVLTACDVSSLPVRIALVTPTSPPTVAPPTNTSIPSPTVAPVSNTPTFVPTRVPTLVPSATAMRSPTRVPTAVPTVTSTPMRPVTVCQDEACLADGVALSYLVVTRPLFIDALMPFINWKTGQGYRVGILTADWLAQKFPGRHLAESMKTGMHTLRRKTGLQYALLVGDTAIPVDKFDIDSVMASYTLTQPWNVPTGFHRRGHSDPPKDVLPNDTYFVEDRDWDPNNTGLNPIPDQSNSRGKVDATLYVGRWSVRTPAEIAPIFAKTQAVQPTNKIFFTGDASLSHPDAEHIKHCPALPFTADPYWCYGSPEVTRIYLFGQNAPWLTTERLVVNIGDNAQVRDLVQRVSVFDGVIDESYHGSWNFLQMPSANTILYNHNYVMLVSVSCMISGFYNDKYETPMESMLKSVKGPAVTVEPPNEFAFMFGLREGQTVGQAFWRSTAEFFDIGAPSVLLGDPSLQIFVTPKR